VWSDVGHPRFLITDIFGIILCLPSLRPLEHKALLKRVSGKVCKAVRCHGSFRPVSVWFETPTQQDGELLKRDMKQRGEAIKARLKKTRLNLLVSLIWCAKVGFVGCTVFCSTCLWHKPLPPWQWLTCIWAVYDVIGKTLRYLSNQNLD